MSGIESARNWVVSIAQPAGYQHSLALLEAAESMVFALRSLGLQATMGPPSQAADALLLSMASSWRGPQPLDPALSWLFARVTADRDARVGRTITLAELLPACADDTGWEAADVLVSWLSGVRDLLGAGFAALDGGPGPARQ